MFLSRLRFLSAGESHGPMLVGILDGLPAGLRLDLTAVDAELRRRMAGYGRGKRMKIESDRARFVGGLRHGETLGGPLAWLIENRDWVNWERVMSPEPVPSAGEASSGDGVAESGDRPGAAPDARRVTRPRPGHADLAGGIKYDRVDLRDVLERASARETASRVAAGAVCRQLLAALDVRIASHVVRIGPAAAPADFAPSFAELAGVDASPVRCADSDTADAMVAAIDRAANDLETLGGTFEVVATGLPTGLGSHVQWDRRLEARIGGAMLSIQAQKGVEIGAAAEIAARPGSSAHDAIHRDPDSGAWSRPTNRAGGTEGGMTYGGDLRVRVHMKPLSTLRQPLPSVDILTGEAVDAVVQRSDVCAVPAAGVVGEAMLALVLADACLEKFGGDSMREMLRNAAGFREQAARYPARQD